MRTSRRGNVDPFIVMDVMEAARRREKAGANIIHMEVGQPGSPAPTSALHAVVRATEHSALGYTVALGLTELRERISDLYLRRHGICVDPSRIVVTSGSSAGFLLAFCSLFDSGDRVAIGEPGYPSYRNILMSLGMTAVGIQTSPEHRYQPQPEDITPDLSGVLIASPANPTGTMLSLEEQSSLIRRARQQNVAYISDEIYHGITYGGTAVSALEISDDVYVINSFSKYHSMTGWRIGWMVVPPDHVRRVECLAQNMFICPPHVSQIAAIGALDAEVELEKNLQVYRANRDRMMNVLPEIGFTKLAPPDGAFYVYADVSEYTDDSLSLCRRILEEAGVAVTPGLDFDPNRGGTTVRFSYSAGTPDINEGLSRLRTWMRKNY